MDHEFLFSSQRGEPAPCCLLLAGGTTSWTVSRSTIEQRSPTISWKWRVFNPSKSADGLRMLRRSLRPATWLATLLAIWRATRRSCRTLTPDHSNPQTSFGCPRYAPRKDSLASFRSICGILAAAFGDNFLKQQF